MKTYLFTVLAAVTIVMLTVAGINLWVDPFNMFGNVFGGGAPHYLYKPSAGRHERLGKPYRIDRAHANYIVLGSSRSLAIPANYCVSDKLHGLNIALSDGTIYEAYRMFQDANYVHRLKRVVIGIDEQLSAETRTGFDDSRFLVKANGEINHTRFLTRMHDIVLSLFTFDALRGSLNTLSDQPRKGESLDAFLLRNKRQRVIRAGGHHQMFRTMEQSVMWSYAKKPAASCNATGLKYDHEDKRGAVYLKRMLETAYRENIHFYIYFNPLHARLQEAWCLGGRGAIIENTKRIVVNMVDSLAKRYGRKPFPVWDFSGYNSITTEPVPKRGDLKARMKYYWEDSHFNERVAKMILAKMYGCKDNVPKDFGVRLTSATLEQHLQQIREQHLLYVKTHPADIKELRSMVGY